uniref:Uncharacterized protein n=1 Tax=Arundo donax TaxID=35708 RepID=A0A0A9BVF0_ARUDO
MTSLAFGLLDICFINSCLTDALIGMDHEETSMSHRSSTLIHLAILLPRLVLLRAHN